MFSPLSEGEGGGGGGEGEEDNSVHDDESDNVVAADDDGTQHPQNPHNHLDVSQRRRHVV